MPTRLLNRGTSTGMSMRGERDDALPSNAALRQERDDRLSKFALLRFQRTFIMTV
jgi:hypothetical protein